MLKYGARWMLGCLVAFAASSYLMWRWWTVENVTVISATGAFVLSMVWACSLFGCIGVPTGGFDKNGWCMKREVRK